MYGCIIICLVLAVSQQTTSWSQSSSKQYMMILGGYNGDQNDARYVHLLSLDTGIEVPECLIGRYSFPLVLTGACSAVLTSGDFHKTALPKEDFID